MRLTTTCYMCSIYKQIRFSENNRLKSKARLYVKALGSCFANSFVIKESVFFLIAVTFSLHERNYLRKTNMFFQLKIFPFNNNKQTFT